MLLAGETMERIMLKGGWKSESTVMHYLRAMVLLLQRLQQFLAIHCQLQLMIKIILIMKKDL